MQCDVTDTELIPLLFLRDEIEAAIYKVVRPAIDAIESVKFPHGTVYLDEIHTEEGNILLFFHVRNGRRHGPAETTMALPYEVIQRGDPEELRTYVETQECRFDGD